MANGTRWTMSHGRLFAAYTLAALGLFIGCFGVGLWNAGTIAIGVAIGVVGPALLLASTMRANTRQFIYGTAHVHEASPPPASGTIGRAELHLSVYAEGIDGVAVRVLDPAVPVSKWPDDGAQLPVEVDAKNPRRVRVLWDKVLTHAQAGGEDLYPGFGTTDHRYDDESIADDLDAEFAAASYDRAGFRRDDDFGGNTATMTDLPPVPPGPPPPGPPPPGPPPPGPPPPSPPAPRSPAPHSTPTAGPSLTKVPAAGSAMPGAGSPAIAPTGPSPGPTSPVRPPAEPAGPTAAAPASPAPTPSPEAGSGDPGHSALAAPSRPSPHPRQPGDDEPPEPETPNGTDRAPISPVYIEGQSLNAPPTWPMTAESGEVPERPETRPEPDDTEVVMGTIQAGRHRSRNGGVVTGSVIDDSGGVIDETGRVIDETGRVIDDTGRVIDDTGRSYADRSETDLIDVHRPKLRLVESKTVVEPDDADIIDADVVKPDETDAGPFLATRSAGTAKPGTGSDIGIGTGADITLQVRDLDRSIEFYRDIIGFNEVEIDDYADTAVLALGDAEILLHEVAEPDPVDPRIVHLNLEVPDVYAAHDDLRAKGVEFVHPPKVVSRGDHLELWAATFRDPDGHAIALTRWEPRR